MVWVFLVLWAASMVAVYTTIVKLKRGGVEGLRAGYEANRRAAGQVDEQPADAEASPSADGVESP